jgi:hypothetical protein
MLYKPARETKDVSNAPIDKGGIAYPSVPMQKMENPNKRMIRKQALARKMRGA